MLKRLTPTGSDILVTLLGGSLPLAMGASPPPDASVSGMLMALFWAALTAGGGLIGKTLIVFFFALIRAKGRAMMLDKDPGNDALGEALIDAANRGDPGGAQGTAPPKGTPIGRIEPRKGPNP